MTYYQSFRKFNSKKVNVGGVQYDSKFEGGKAAELELMKRGGAIKKFEAHTNEELKAYGEHICYYKVDFKVYHNDGTIEFIETKGYATPDWKLKWKMFEAKYKKQARLGKVKLTLEMQGRQWTPRRFRSNTK